ncbi:MAG: M13 family metallopeptidase [Bacteroidota bacterium]
MKKLLCFTLILSSIFIFNSCKNKGKKNANIPDALATHIDSTVKPGEDFFLFANGKWFKENPIPNSEQSNGIFQLVQDTINAQVKSICETSASNKNAEKGSNKQKIGDFYFSGMDSVSLNKKGISDIKEDLSNIDNCKNIDDLVKMAAYLHSTTSSPFFSFGIMQDEMNSSKHAIYISQGGISLPDRSYYIDNDAQATKVRKEFTTYANNMFMILGYANDKAKASAEQILKLETQLAKASRKNEDTRDPFLNYNKKTFKQLTELTPNYNWTIFFNNLGLNKVDSVIIGQPEYLSSLNLLLKTTKLDIWKDYLKLQLIGDVASYLDDKSYMEAFNFYYKALRGVQEPKPRWERVVSKTNRSLGELIGQVYVEEYLPKGTKEKLLEIGNAIREVYAERIKGLDWMSAATKEKALAKLNAIIMKVGFPDKWKDMKALEISRDSYYKNVMNANKWEFKRMISKYGKPVDRNEWDIQPQEYNAYYNPSNNEIVIPGCNILVPGYEGRLADDAILYSVIGGSTFAHEITHGFDDQGSKFDINGNLNNWWTKDDSTQFYTRTKKIVAQFSKYIAVDSLHINGEYTQGENIADLAGVIMGYEAFKKTKQFKENEKIGGYTPQQRYFLGYASAWMLNSRPEALANQVRSDVHSPAKFRVLGPLSNMPEFFEAFGVKEGDAMWQADSLRVKIW